MGARRAVTRSEPPGGGVPATAGCPGRCALLVTQGQRRVGLEATHQPHGAPRPDFLPHVPPGLCEARGAGPPANGLFPTELRGGLREQSYFYRSQPLKPLS